MRSALFIAVATAGLSAPLSRVVSPTSAPHRSEGSEISFDAGTGNSNTDFMY